MTDSHLHNEFEPYKFDDEELVFITQLVQVRHDLQKLMMEERTLEDKLLSILRGHRRIIGYGGNMIVRRYVGSRNSVFYEYIILNEM